MPMDAAHEAMRDENDALHLELYRMRKKLLECELQRDYLRSELDALAYVPCAAGGSGIMVMKN